MKEQAKVWGLSLCAKTIPKQIIWERGSTPLLLDGDLNVADGVCHIAGAYKFSGHSGAGAGELQCYGALCIHRRHVDFNDAGVGSGFAVCVFTTFTGSCDGEKITCGFRLESHNVEKLSATSGVFLSSLVGLPSAVAAAVLLIHVLGLRVVEYNGFA